MGLKSKRDSGSEAPVDKGFLRRLEIACADNPNCPEGHGRQSWILTNLEERFGLKLSAEATSRWFRGLSRPNFDTMGKLAAVLEVDVAWLSFGKTPELTINERKKHVLYADGSVNLAAGFIQMAGAQIAFNEDPDSGVDFFAIIHGKHHAIKVTGPAKVDGEKIMFVLPVNGHRTALGVIGSESFNGVKILRFTPEQIEKHGKRKGRVCEIVVDHSGPNYLIGKQPVQVVTSLADFS